MLTDQKARDVKDLAKQHGFSFCGISRAQELTDEARELEQWLSQGLHGKMQYMQNHFEKRIDPRKLVDGAKTVISFLYNYATTDQQKDPSAPKISKYAYGKDYHIVIQEKLKAILNILQEKWGDIHGRAFVDSAPVLEKAWAQKSGLGWIGKHTNLINKQQGSYFFLAELIIDMEIMPDAPMTKDYCGTCTACIDACPTNAIIGPRQLDASKCISYFTIELKEAIPDEMKGAFQNRMFGCDICQDVCPWNRFSKKHQEPAFEPNEEIVNFTKKEWTEITEEIFQKIFQDSPIKRAGFSGLRRNIDFLSLNTIQNAETAAPTP